MILLYIFLQLLIRPKLYVNRLLNILFCWIILVFAYKLPVGVFTIQPNSIPSLQPSILPTTHPSMNKVELTCISSNVITKNISGVDKKSDLFQSGFPENDLQFIDLEFL